MKAKFVRYYGRYSLEFELEDPDEEFILEIIYDYRKLLEREVCSKVIKILIEFLKAKEKAKTNECQNT